MINSKVMRVDFTKPLEYIHKQIYEIINYIKQSKNNLGNSFIQWDCAYEANPKKYVELGYIRE